MGYSQTTVPFTSTTTWICPVGVTQISIEAWGGGGAGGGATANPSAGGGGAGGAYVKNTTLTVTPGASYNVTVGATKTGTQLLYKREPIFFRADSYSRSPSHQCRGGNGGAVSSTNSSSAAGGAAVATGNIGGTTSNIYGSAGLTGTGAGGSRGGNGGASGGGAAGATGSTSDANGAAGSTYGGGGAGGKSSTSTDRNGGNGAAGQIIISYDSPELILKEIPSLLQMVIILQLLLIGLILGHQMLVSG